MHPRDQYIQDVLTGKQVTGKLVRLAVERHVADLEKDWEYYFDEVLAQKAIDFFQVCRHWKGEWAGERINLEPFQQFHISLLYGWRNKSDGTRRFRTFYYEVARKNAKTTEAALFALEHVVKSGEDGAQAYFFATKEDQARIGFRDVQEIIRKTPELKKRFKNFTKSSVYDNSFIKPLGSDSNTSDGLDPSLGVGDEVHAHPNDKMINVIESGMGSRREPLMVLITTAGFHKEYPCYSNIRKSCIDILSGIKNDETTLALIYTLDDDDDWTDESNWVKANPNLGVSVKMEFLQNRFIKAKNEGSSKEVDFKTKNLNVWTDTAETWIPDDKYMACEREMPDFDGMECYGGLDLSSTRDITAFVLRFRVDGIDYKKYWYFVPEDRVKHKSQRDDFKYQNWIRDGWMIATPGDVTDYGFIKEVIMNACEEYDVRIINYDRWNSSQLVIDLVDEGVPMNPFGQGYASMGTPTREYEKRIYSKEEAHNGNPVTRWMLSNVALRRDPAGNIKVDKEKSMDKVDGIVADIMSLGALMDDDNQGPSVYEERGVLTLDDI